MGSSSGAGGASWGVVSLEGGTVVAGWTGTDSAFGGVSCTGSACDGAGLAGASTGSVSGRDVGFGGSATGIGAGGTGGLTGSRSLSSRMLRICASSSFPARSAARSRWTRLTLGL